VLAEELHFSRAATRLGVAQSTLSVRLRELERELDVRLFDRSTRKVELTDAGRRLLEEARSTLAVMADTLDVVRAPTDRDARLRVGCSTAARYGITEPLLDRYERRSPTTLLSVREEATGGLLRALVERRLDVVVSYCQSAPDEFRGERLMQVRAVALVPSADPLARRETVTLAELVRLPLVRVEDTDSSGINTVGLAACRAAGVQPQLTPIPRGDAHEAMRRSGGFAFVTPTASRFGLHGLTAVALRGPAPVLFYDLIWREADVPGLSAFLTAARRERAARRWLSG